MKTRTVKVAVVLGLGALLSGCSSYLVRGRVIEGPVTTALVVRADDPRFEEEGLGLEGYEIEITGRGSRLLVESTRNGMLRIRPPKGETEAVALRILADDETLGQANVYLPRSGQVLLVVVEPDG